MAEFKLDEQTKKEAMEARKKATQNVKKGRKSVVYLQKCKDEGKKLVQVCPQIDPLWTTAAEMADVDIVRLVCVGKNRGDYDLSDHDMKLAPWWIRQVRNMASIIHINYHAETPTFCSPERAIHYGSIYINAGADSLLTMGIKNDIVKVMSDNYIPLFGHIGIMSGWMTQGLGGFRRVGKTAEEAMQVYRMGYEYQENGMKAMTIEMTPIEVSTAIAKKLRVPVISIAGGAACDGSEMVDSDTFNLVKGASHAKAYADFYDWATDAYGRWVEDVRTEAYPTDDCGWHMKPEELEKFNDMIEKA